MLALVSTSSDERDRQVRAIEEGHVLLHAVLEDLEVLLPQIGEVVASPRP